MASVQGAGIPTISGVAGRQLMTADVGGQLPSIPESVLSVRVWAEKMILRHSRTCFCRGR